MKINFRAIMPDRTAVAALCLLSLFLFCGISSISAQQYEVTNLVSDVPGLAKITDPLLVNPWGLDASASGPWWVANNGTGTSTLYNGAGVKNSLVVTVAGGTSPSEPTGIVFNGSSDFKLTTATNSVARFIFVTDDGTISGWAPALGNTTIIKFTSNSGAVYLGATIAQSGGNNFLYVADFSHASVDVFDKNYAPVTLAAGAFTDPELPDGYAPFNVQNINGNVYVAYAKQNEDGDEEEAGRGLGYVNVYSSSGALLGRFEHGWWMNAPWGLAMAPVSGFGKASGKLLVGMFGSGQVATFDPATGEFTGLLRGERGVPIEIEGLWALRFGNGGSAGPTTTLYFTAGIEDETHGLFGTITPIPKQGNGPNGDDDDDS